MTGFDSAKQATFDALSTRDDTASAMSRVSQTRVAATHVGRPGHVRDA
jgi:hypothetical protein